MLQFANYSKPDVSPRLKSFKQKKIRSRYLHKNCKLITKRILKLTLQNEFRETKM